MKNYSLFILFLILYSCELSKNETIQNNDAKKIEYNNSDIVIGKLSKDIIGKTVMIKYNQKIEDFKVSVLWNPVGICTNIYGTAIYYFKKNNDIHIYDEKYEVKFGLEEDFLDQLTEKQFTIKNDTVTLFLDSPLEEINQNFTLTDYNFDNEKEIAVTNYCEFRGSPSLNVLDFSEKNVKNIFTYAMEWEIDTAKQSIFLSSASIHGCATKVFFKNGKEACKLNICPFYKNEEQKNEIIGTEYILEIQKEFEGEFYLLKNGKKTNNLKNVSLDSDPTKIEVEHL